MSHSGRTSTVVEEVSIGYAGLGTVGVTDRGTVVLHRSRGGPCSYSEVGGQVMVQVVVVAVERG